MERAASARRVILNTDDSGVAEVRLNRPDKMNALDPAMFSELVAVSERLRGEKGLRAVVIFGEGRAFCSGLDVASFANMSKNNAEQDGLAHLAERTHGIANLAQQVAWGWHTLPVPVIAALHGVVFGGGLQIALGADIRFIAPDTKLSVMEIKWGIVPDMAGTVLMRGLVRNDVVRDLTFSGRIVSGEEACQLGLATRVSASPLEEARSYARSIAQSNPHAVRAAKRLLNGALQENAESQLLAESVEQQRLIGSDNQTEAVRAVQEKRLPTFVDPP
jgi:enoyl-CoA hydratase/carnithine racemase